MLDTAYRPPSDAYLRVDEYFGSAAQHVMVVDKPRGAQWLLVYACGAGGGGGSGRVGAASAAGGGGGGGHK